jgi:hypothetical protein
MQVMMHSDWPRRPFNVIAYELNHAKVIAYNQNKKDTLNFLDTIKPNQDSKL